MLRCRMPRLAIELPSMFSSIAMQMASQEAGQAREANVSDESGASHLNSAVAVTRRRCPVVWPMTHGDCLTCDPQINPLCVLTAFKTIALVMEEYVVDFFSAKLAALWLPRIFAVFMFQGSLSPSLPLYGCYTPCRWRSKLDSDCGLSASWSVIVQGLAHIPFYIIIVRKV